MNLQEMLIAIEDKTGPKVNNEQKAVKELSGKEKL